MSAPYYSDEHTYPTARKHVAESVPERHETPDVAELRRLAEAATPGPWWHEWADGDDWWAVYGQPTGDMVCPEVCTMWGADESAYIAAANPAAVLGLLDEADALRAELAHTTEVRRTLAAGVERLIALVAHMTEARDNARTEVERLTGQIEAAKRIGLGAHLGRPWADVLNDVLRTLDATRQTTEGA